MRTLKEEKEYIEGKNFSNISNEEKERMTKISNTVRSPKVFEQVMSEAIQTVHTVKPNISRDDSGVAVAMIVASVCNTIHTLIEDSILKYVE